MMGSGSMNLGITVSADCSSCIGSTCAAIWNGFVSFVIDAVDCIDGVGGALGTDDL